MPVALPEARQCLRVDCLALSRRPVGRTKQASTLSFSCRGHIAAVSRTATREIAPNPTSIRSQLSKMCSLAGSSGFSDVGTGGLSFGVTSYPHIGMRCRMTVRPAAVQVSICVENSGGARALQPSGKRFGGVSKKQLGSRSAMCVGEFGWAGTDGKAPVGPSSFASCRTG